MSTIHVERTVSMKMFWRGRDIEELSREELIEALRACYVLYEEAVDSHRRTIETWHDISRFRSSR